MNKLSLLRDNWQIICLCALGFIGFVVLGAILPPNLNGFSDVVMTPNQQPVNEGFALVCLVIALAVVAITVYLALRKQPGAK